MTISRDYYQGVLCEIKLDEESSMACFKANFASCSTVVANQFIDYVGENDIRNAFVLDLESNAEQGLESTIIVQYSGERLTGFTVAIPLKYFKSSTSWEIINRMCTAIDTIQTLIRFKMKSKPERKIALRKGSMIDLKLVNGNLVIEHIDEPEFPWHHGTVIFESVGNIFTGQEHYFNSKVPFIVVDDIYNDFFDCIGEGCDIVNYALSELERHIVKAI